MKILLVCRGSQGDVYPYLGLAKRLEERGHQVTLNIPFQFEEFAKQTGVPYTVEGDDMHALVSNQKLGLQDLFEWVSRVIKQQFDDLVPMLENYDAFVASNTEFAAASIAEYTKKPFIRTAYAPLMESRKIMPPMTPLARGNFILTPRLMWKFINMGADAMVRKNLNKGRVALGMKPIKSQTAHAPATATINLMMYSPTVGEIDNDWAFKWGNSGYCFNDILPYKKEMHDSFVKFINKDDKPALFFSLGSINGPLHGQLAEWLMEICQKHNYKLVVGSGWWKVGQHLPETDDLFLLDSVIPHKLVFPLCNGIIHHGGSGTTHSAFRSGRPQIAMPHVLDQYYWARRGLELGVGPGAVNSKKITTEKLESYVVDLMTNETYKKNAAEIGKRVQAENGLDNAVDLIEKSVGALSEENAWPKAVGY